MKKLINIILISSILILLNGCFPFFKDTVDLRIRPGVDNININEEWIDAGAALTVGELYIEMDRVTNPDTSTLGLYEVKYTATYDEEEYEIIRYVRVYDQIDPILELNPGVDTINLGETWVDAGATALDNSNEILTCIPSGTVNNLSAGVYEITYTATDTSGNTGTIIRYVTVLE